jgi:hypothetical protein
MTRGKFEDFGMIMSRNKNRINVCLFFLLILGFAARTALAQEKLTRIDFSPQIADYGPVLSKALNDLYDAGGGTLEIAYGEYPLQTPVLLKRTDVDGKTVDIAIKGTKNPAGERPLFYCVADPGKTHVMFNLRGGWKEGGNAWKPGLGISVSGLEIVGNNVPVNRLATNVPGDDGVSAPWAKIPWSDQPANRNYGHPFLHHNQIPAGDAIMGVNLRTLHVDDVVIRDVYGNGIYSFCAGWHEDQRTAAPSVTNTRIINTWQWQDGFKTGDGIIFWFANKPRVENCVIYNDISYTRWIGRTGIVLEHFTQDGLIQNNIISGYGRNIHIEQTYGGHQIIGNKLLASDFGVFLNEPAWTDATKAARVKPDIIKDNYFEYNMERITYKTFPFGGRRSFVDTFLLTPKLKGLQIIDNTFVYNDGKPLPKNRQVYIGPVDEKDYAEQGFVVQGNIFK